MNFLKYISVALITLLLSCSDQKKSILIPESLSQNEKVKVYFETLDEVIDQYVTMIEEVAETTKQNRANDFGNAIQGFSTLASSTLKIAPLLEKMEKLNADGEVLKDELSQEELSAFIETYTKLIARFQEASLKINN